MTTEHVRRTPAPPEGTYIGMPKFAKNAKVQLADNQLRKNLRKATGTIRAKRVARVAEVPEWEELRLAGEAIKNRTLRHLDTYLIQLEESLTRAGAQVHWARDAA
jgi:L-lactate dehydrogenase complex protein LldF